MKQNYSLGCYAITLCLAMYEMGVILYKLMLPANILPKTVSHNWNGAEQP